VPAEILTAVGVLIPASHRVASIAAVILLGAFSGVLASNLLRGHTPVCHCFGELTSKPIGAGSLVRNAILVGLAVAAGLPLTATSAAAMSAGALLSFAVGAALPEINARTTDRRTAIGRQASRFRVSSSSGVDLTLDGLLARGAPLLLVFTDVGCGPCQRLLAEVAEWQRSLSATLTTLVLSRGDQAEAQHHAHEFELDEIAFDSDVTVAARYGCLATPSAVVVDPAGKIASTVGVGAGEIRALVAGVVGELPRARREIGDPLPYLELQDSGGKDFELPHGKPVLLISGSEADILELVDELEDVTDYLSVVLLLAAALPSSRTDLTVAVDLGSANASALGLTEDLSAILVDADLMISSRVLCGARAIVDAARRSTKAAIIAVRLSSRLDDTMSGTA
jgi:peroxiredoxin